MKMKIIVLEGSPNQHGSSNMLADNFIRGAEEAGHTVKVIDAAHADIHPCIGCIHCGYEGPCVQKDDVEKFPSGYSGGGYDGICHTAVLLRNVSAAQNTDRPVSLRV